MRDEILARVRAANAGIGVPEVPRHYRLFGEHPSGDPNLVTLLTDRLTDYRASVRHTARADLPALLTTLTGAGRAVVPAGFRPDWRPAHVSVDTGLDYSTLDSTDSVVTGCAAACAETGTIALDGSPDQGRRVLTLIPDTHICVVETPQIVQTVPELLQRLDPRRPLTLISGPSATSDIELNRVEGVHGPRTLIVVLVTD